ncbi:gem-associated protein 2-like isoform X2 [Dendronephthya gigantea]|uniref:gem-associated protein 2-like isoform X2 n=1 Tax=Dendronephthya gigantea TaxID=151771 RepID=UPI0010697F9E|nr:gem-associated protein 2-like isoform X2 [Dendronephthya gigantea]
MEPVFSLKHLSNGKDKTKNSLTDTSSFPSTAYDYLKHVQDEAACCPDIVVATMDCSVFSANQDPNFTTVEAIKTSEDNKVPSAEWKNEQVSAFAEIRQFLAHQKALFKEKKIKKRKLPDAENEHRWFQFCIGNNIQLSNNQCEEETEGAGEDVQDEEDNSGTPALLSIICQMNQSTVLMVLDHHINWLKRQPFTVLQGQWIYALLTAIEKPLLPDSTYSLRTLARLCSKQKEKLTPEQKDERAALYLIILLVMRYFGQSDLAGPAS